MSATAIPLTDFAWTLDAAARWHGVQKKHRELLHERLLPALAQTAWDADAEAVAMIAKSVSTLGKHPKSSYSETVNMAGGVRLG
jgi:hypothetical protein